MLDDYLVDMKLMLYLCRWEHQRNTHVWNAKILAVEYFDVFDPAEGEVG